MTDAPQSDDIVQPPPQRAGKRRMRRVWRWLAWGVLLTLLLLALLAGYVWKNRYALLEGRAVKAFAEMGIEAELSIDHIGMHEAALKNVKLSADGKLFFAAARAEFTYPGREVLGGTFESMRFIRPFVHLTLDENGKIIDGWVPESSTGGQGLQIPQGGVFVENGTLDFATPWASGKAAIDAEIRAPANWNVHFQTQNLPVNAQGVSANLDIKGVAEALGANEFTVIGEAGAAAISAQNAAINSLGADFSLAVTSITQNTAGPAVKGWTQFTAQGVKLPDVLLGNIAAKLDIDAKLDANYRVQRADIGWDIDSRSATVPDAATRKLWSSAILPYDLLNNVPIAKYFANDFAAKSNALLQDFAMAGQGSLQYGEQGYRIDWQNPLRIRGTYKGAPQILTLKPSKPAPQIAFDKAAKTMTAAMNVGWSGRRALEIYGLQLSARSENGLGLSQTQRVSAHIRSTSTWTARAEENGQAAEVRLAPFDIDFSYLDPPSPASGRSVKLAGGIDYDGFLPGGMARDFRAAGRIGIDLRQTGFVMEYVPASQVTMGGFESSTGWRGENLRFDVINADRVLDTAKPRRPMAFGLSGFTGHIIGPDDLKHLDADIQRIDIRTAFAASPQVWDLDIFGAALRSDDFPAPGTLIMSERANMQVTQFSSGGMEFRLDTPNASVDTDLVNVRNLEITLGGRPDNIHADYRAGRVRFTAKDPAGNDLPVLSFPGTARLSGGVLTGQGNAVLPMTKNTPIDVNFRSENGQADIAIDIPSIKFQPGGLQPQLLVPALKGKLAGVNGAASAHFDFSFGGGAPVTSSGRAVLENIDFATLVGPFAGINAELEFASILPLVTKGVQRASIDNIDPGFPLKDGQFTFEIVNDGIRIDEAYWPIDNGPDKAAGRIFLEPALWRFGNVQNKVTARVADVALGTLLEDIGKESFSATGQINGKLPVVIEGVKLLVEDGVLAVRDGGTIRFKTKQTDAAAAANEQAGYAFGALENFEYKQMEARLNGPLDGEMALKIVFEGRNPEILVGTPFEFNVEIVGELANIVRNTINAYKIKDDVGRALEMQKAQDLANPAAQP